MTGVTDGVDGVTDGVTDSVTDGVTDGVTDRFAEETLTISLVVLFSLSNAYFVPPPLFSKEGSTPAWEWKMRCRLCRTK